MYAQHFGLGHEPFSIAPDPRYLYLGERHREALAHLLYGLQAGGGFVLLTGEIGAGKTTVCRCFLEQVPPHCRVAYVFNPRLTVVELLATVCEEFGVPPSPDAPDATPTVKRWLDPLNRFLLEEHAAGRNCVLLIDEAQQLPADVLEQLRLLTNLETGERKLLQIILIGQPELRDLLARPELEQLAQRVIARYHLGPLDEADTARYVAHRLAVAGLHGPTPLPPERMPLLHRLSRGVPRRINLLCDRALLGAYAQGRAVVDAATLRQAAREVDGEPGRRRWRWRARRQAPGTPPREGAGDAVPGEARQGGARWGAGALAGAALGGAAVALLATLPWQGADRETMAGLLPLSSAGAGSAGASEPAGARPAGAASADPWTAAVGAASGPAGGQPLDAAGLLQRARPLAADEAAAWQVLAAQWGTVPGPGDACAATAARPTPPELACYRGTGGLAQLRRLDRPAWLWLRPDGDLRAPATHGLLLVGVDDERLAVRVGDATWTTTPQALAAAGWRGDFATAWRQPLPSEVAARLERWATSLAPAAGAASGTRAEARRRVAAFQSAQGLAPDGRMGPLTVMALNRLTGVDEPRLLRPPRP